MVIAQNRLIARLPRPERRQLMSACKPVELELAQIICEPGTPARAVYFPTSGFISLIALVPDSPGVEVGMVGREGMLGAELVLGVPTVPLHALVQGSGSALRIGARAFRRELADSAALRQILHRYIYVLMGQLTTSSACLRFHLIGQRLARWLLMSQDRAQADTFRVTQEFLAYMLGVRRVGITVAAGALQKADLIDYHRGEVRILDRIGLESAACSCYATTERSFQRFLR